MRNLIFVVLVMLLATSDATAARRARYVQHSNEILVELASVVPYGDLANDFNKTYFGFGAKAGSEMGFRYRYYFSPSFSLSPSFHFANFRSLVGETLDGGNYEIAATSYRYSLELMLMDRKTQSSLRPFIALGFGLFRNRVVGYQKNFYDTFDSSINTLGVITRIGVQISDLEFSINYNINRFHAWRYFNTGYEELYNWDNISFRAGWRLPL